MTRRAALAGAAAAVGVAYALSPLTIWLAVVMALLLHATVARLGPTERRFVIGAVVVALAIRVGAVAWLILASEPGQTANPSFFGDGSYAIGRSLWLRMVWLGEPIHPRYFHEAFDAYGDSGYNFLQAVVQVVLGPAPWALHLLSASIFVAGVLVCFRTVRSCYGRPAAAFVLATLLLWPGWIAWSITPIKDALQFTVTAVVLACVVWWLRAESPGGRVAVAALTVGAIALLSTLRSGAVVVMVVTIGAAFAAAAIARWKATAAAAVAVALIAAVVIVPRTVIPQRVSAEVVAAANRHLGHVRTPGTFYKALDEHLYRPAGHTSLTLDESARFLIRSVAAFVAVPLPWHFETQRSRALLPAQLFWYVLVVLALVALPVALRRHPALTAMLLAYIAISAAIIAPNSGNVGTLARHRDGVVPFVMCLSGVGFSALVSRRARPAAVREEQA